MSVLLSQYAGPQSHRQVEAAPTSAYARAFSELSNSSLEKAAMKHDVLGKVPPKWRLFSFLFFRLVARLGVWHVTFCDIL